MGEPVVRLDEVGLTLPSAAGDVEILRAVTLSIEAGERVAITGPSGSGKSSLLMVMGGLERATGGRAQVLGTDLGAAGEDELARLRRARIGVVFQSFHLIPTMTALENVAVPLEIAAPRRRLRTRRPRCWTRSASRPAPGTIRPSSRAASSSASRSPARWRPARGSCSPTSRPAISTARTGAQVTELLFRLADEQDVTLVLVTHEDALAARCERQVRLDSGRIVAEPVH